jgi:hypothetical protein
MTTELDGAERSVVLELDGLHWATSKTAVEVILGRRPGVVTVLANPVAQTATVLRIWPAGSEIAVTTAVGSRSPITSARPPFGVRSRPRLELLPRLSTPITLGTVHPLRRRGTRPHRDTTGMRWVVRLPTGWVARRR